MSQTIGFIGAGAMGEAIIKGLVNSQVAGADQILAAEPREERRAYLSQTYGIIATPDNLELLRRADVIFLAVKPQVIDAVLAELNPEVRPDQLFISIAAGVTLSKLEAALPAGTRVIRVMPNTPCQVGAGVSAIALGAKATEEDWKLADQLFSAVGMAFTIEEKLFDAVTGLSGSGPAYIYMAIEALSDAGVMGGLPRELATRLAAQTVMGSALMVLETKKHPGELKDMVTSPAGTTIEAVYALEKGGLRAALMDAVQAAKTRAEAMHS